MRTPDEQFSKIATAFQGIARQSDKLRLAFKLFDSEGVALVNTLGIGVENLEKIASLTKKFGLGLSAADADKFLQAGNALKLAGSALKGIFRQIAL